jgi:hypothetical protein
MEKLGFKNKGKNITTPFGISKVILLLPTRNLKVFIRGACFNWHLSTQ